MKKVLIGAGVAIGVLGLAVTGIALSLKHLTLDLSDLHRE